MMDNLDTLTAGFLIAFSLLCCLILILQRRKSLEPKYTPIQLQPKIFPQRTVDNTYGWKNLLGDVVTLGGHSTLKEKQYDYETSYLEYATVFNENIDLTQTAHDEMNQLGSLTFKITQELRRSERFLNKHTKRQTTLNTSLLQESTKNIHSFTKCSNTQYQTGVALLQGTAIGGLAALGSWTLVSLVGTASTGTAIATLSGAAASNATLAWFGGGALAAGGGGMTAGATTLGLIVAVPAIAFATYKSYSKANELEKQTEIINNERESLLKSIEKLKQLNTGLQNQKIILTKYHSKLQEINNLLEKIIYPNGFRSKIKRTINDFLNKDVYSREEVQQIERLARLVNEIHNLFSQKHDTFHQAAIEYQK